MDNLISKALKWVVFIFMYVLVNNYLLPRRIKSTLISAGLTPLILDA